MGIHQYMSRGGECDLGDAVVPAQIAEDLHRGVWKILGRQRAEGVGLVVAYLVGYEAVFFYLI